MKTILLTLLSLTVLGWQSLEVARARPGRHDRTSSNPHSRTDTTISGARLEEYVAVAVQQNPGLKASFYRWKALSEKEGYAGALPDPVFTYLYFGESVETRVGPQRQRIGLEQSFPWFGTLGAKKDIAGEAAGSAFQSYEAEKTRVIYQLKSAYYELYYLGREIEITGQNLRLLEFWESVLRAGYRAALEKHPDLLRAQVELAKTEDRLSTLEAMVEPATARLRAVLNLPDSVSLPLPDRLEVQETAIDRDSVLALITANNPDLKSVLHLVDKEKAGRRLAGKAALPSFTVGVEYIQTGEAVSPDMADSGKDPWAVKLGISLPVWFGANKARRNETQAQIRLAENQYSEAQNQLRVLADKFIYEHDNALRKTRLYRDGLVPKAEQALNASYAAYRAGEIEFINVLDAQRQLLEFQLQYERARSNLAISRAAIGMITGSVHSSSVHSRKGDQS